MNLLALSGSLRRDSINTAFLRALAQRAPQGVQVQVFDGLGALPLFSPDLDGQPPPGVKAYQQAVANAHALVIASPEYAHAMTGTLKNALDWLVGFEPFAGKPVLVVNTSPRAHHADASLRETLSTMAARLVGVSSVVVPLLGGPHSDQALRSSPVVTRAVHDILAALQSSIAAGDGGDPP